MQRVFWRGSLHIFFNTFCNSICKNKNIYKKVQNTLQIDFLSSIIRVFILRWPTGPWVHMAEWSSWKLAWLITTRSVVRIHPLATKRKILYINFTKNLSQKGAVLLCWFLSWINLIRLRCAIAIIACPTLCALFTIELEIIVLGWVVVSVLVPHWRTCNNLHAYGEIRTSVRIKTRTP